MGRKGMLASLLLCTALMGCTEHAQSEGLWKPIEPVAEAELEHAQFADGLYLGQTVQTPAKDPYPADTRAVSEGTTENGIAYVLYENHAEIVGHSDHFAEKELVIPEQLEGKPVTRIASVTVPDTENMFEADKNGAFYGCYTLEKVIIPEGLYEIGDYAFCGCKNLEEVVMPESVTAIGARAFALCANLKEMSVPAAIDTIGDSAFSLTPWYDNLLYHHALIIFNGRLYDAGRPCTGAIEVPDYVVQVCDSAFYACNQLTAVRLPESVVSIGCGAFQDCAALKEVVIENPDCEIYDADSTFSNRSQAEQEVFEGTLYGTEESSAAKFAKKYRYDFGLLGTEKMETDVPAETETAAPETTAETTETTTTEE